MENEKNIGLNHSEPRLTRRDFLRLSGQFGAGAVISTALSACGPLEALFQPRYNKNKLLALTDLEPQSKIDARIGVTCVNGVYPRESEIGFFQYNVDVAARLGFQTVEIALVPQEFPEHTGIDIPAGTTLDALAQREDVAYVFNHPSLKRIFVTTETGGEGTVHGWDFKNKEAFTPEALEANYQEYYRFASLMLDKFGENGKEIVISGPNELDWHLFGDTSANHIDEDPTDHALDNARKYLDTFLKAITDANKDHPDVRPLSTAVEINRVRDIWKDKKRILNAVLPNLAIQPDIISYSSYDTLDKGQLFSSAIDEIKKRAPQSAVVISEFGLPENRADVKTRFSEEEIAMLYQERISEALAKGVKNFMIWTLTDNECEQVNPDNDRCSGFGIVRPDATLSKVYEAVSRFKQN